MIAWFMSAFILFLIISAMVLGSSHYDPITVSLLGILFWCCAVIGCLKAGGLL